MIEILQGTIIFLVFLVLSSVSHDKIFEAKFFVPRHIKPGEALVCEEGKWRALLYPRGRSSGNDSGLSSFYLQYLDSEITVESPVNFDVSLYDASRTSILEKFQCDSCDFERISCHGIEDFVAEEYFTDTMLGCLDCDDCVYLNVKFGDFLAREHHAYDLHADIEPVGLVNQGNTCYLNSLIQMVYNVPNFRTCILNSFSCKGTSKALKKVFKELTQGLEAASTICLTSTMGINTSVQQDAQEFGRFMFMSLLEEGDEKIREGVDFNFKGIIENYINCTSVPYGKSWKEDFYDLSLDIFGFSSLENSLDKFVEPEILSGDNRWKAGDFGLQEATKGIRLIHLPQVLQFHLKRFQYDYETGSLNKLNDRFTFPPLLNLSKWFGKDGMKSLLDDENSSNYSLSGVLMHVGSANFGHYYTYIKQKSTGDWFKLDDSRVSKVSYRTVTSDAFGKRGVVGHFLGGIFGHSESRNSSAYMLQYSRIPNIQGAKEQP